MDNVYEIAFKKLNPSAKVPTNHDKGKIVDIYAAEDKFIVPGETVAVGTGLAFTFPDVLGLMFMPVSGLSTNTSLRYANGPFVLQNNYYEKEEVKIRFQNTYGDGEKVEKVPEYKLIDGSVISNPGKLYTKGTVKICKGDCISRMMPVDAFYQDGAEIDDMNGLY